MIYDIKQKAHYDYASSVPFAKHALRLLPLIRPGQSTTAVSIKIDPPPSERFQTSDFFGNGVLMVDLDAPHDSFTVTVSARVRVEPPMPLMAELTPPWEEVRDRALASADLSSASPVHFLFPSRSITLDEELGRYAAESFPAKRSVLEGAFELAKRIHDDFVYEPGATEVSTPALQAFRLKRGVCQDFAHVMISGLRWLGLPAGYVSGYLRTVPPPGRPRLQGVDAMHAWVMLWAGEEIGWCGLDPTNASMALDDHIVVATGRDYTDVAPIEGILYGPGNQKLKTEVDVVPVG